MEFLSRVLDAVAIARIDHELKLLVGDLLEFTL